MTVSRKIITYIRQHDEKLGKPPSAIGLSLADYDALRLEIQKEAISLGDPTDCTFSFYYYGVPVVRDPRAANLE